MRVLVSFVFITLVFGFIACSKEKEPQPPENKAFDVFCTTFESLVANPDFEEMDSEVRAVKLDSELEKVIGQNTAAYVAWSAIRNASPEDRWFLYGEAAKSIDYSDWKCSAVEKYASKVGSATH